MIDSYDVIVVGVGGMGSAACQHLASRGQRVLGLEQFPLVHDRGSSHGETRIIRQAYFEHPDYVPLLLRTYELWNDLERNTRRTLFHQVGLILSGVADGETIAGARNASRLYEIPLENLTGAEARRRWNLFQFPDEHDVVFELKAGFLRVEACVQAQIDQAIQLGAAIHADERMIEWQSTGNTVVVRTDRATYSAGKLVIAAGAWAGQYLAQLGLPLKIARKFVGWFRIPPNREDAFRGIPTYFFELPHGTFYGFPSIDGQTAKLAEHSGGQPIADPANVDRECHADDTPRLMAFVQGHLPGLCPDLDRHSVCLYTLTPDQHFIIDRHPEHDNVAIAAGFSGHGFKFTPVVGEALADLATHGTTDLPIRFLGIDRFHFDHNRFKST